MKSKPEANQQVFLPPTLKDVAAFSDCSTATVSRCINSPDKVSPKIRQRVDLAIARLGYTVNYSAKSLAGKLSNTVGAIIPTLGNAIFAQGLQAFHEELAKAGFSLLMSSSVYSPDIEETQIKNLVSRGVDGILLIGKYRKQKIYDFLDQRGVPYTIAWFFDVSNRVQSVGFLNLEAMKTMALKVLEMGHREIAYITANYQTNDRAKARLDGVKAAMKEYGLDVNSLQVVKTEYSIQKGGEAFKRLLSLPSKPTAVMCGNDILAVGAIKEARRMGLSIPHDVSVTGFDDIEIATVIEPALTTVHVPHKKMGIEAARTLIEQIRNRNEHKSVLLNTHLVLRDSLSHPPKKMKS